jgi:carnitine 3-dehydrogenase
LFHILETDNGNIVATGEHMLLHVSLETRSSSLPSEKIASNLSKLFKPHSTLPWPEGVGRSIGNK